MRPSQGAISLFELLHVARRQSPFAKAHDKPIREVDIAELSIVRKMYLQFGEVSAIIGIWTLHQPYDVILLPVTSRTDKISRCLAERRLM